MELPSRFVQMEAVLVHVALLLQSKATVSVEHLRQVCWGTLQPDSV